MNDAEALNLKIVFLFKNHHVDNISPSEQRVSVSDSIGQNPGIECGDRSLNVTKVRPLGFREHMVDGSEKEFIVAQMSSTW